MLTPRKLKFRKSMRGKIKNLSLEGHRLEFGKFGIKSLEKTWLTARQIEAARRAMTRHIRRGGQIWIRVFPDKPVTQRPPETGMGGGKGAVDHFVVPISPGRIIFEMDGVEEGVAKDALYLAARKLPIKTRFISKES